MKPAIPLLVELCAGTAALSLRLHRAGARPPVSRMGAKTGYADAILDVLGLHPGDRAEHYLWCEPDPGTRLLLEAYRDPALAAAAADVLLGWKDEPPRDLWERLRAEGPPRCPPADAREVARAVLLVRWSFSERGPDKGYGGPGSRVATENANWTTEQRDRALGCERTARLLRGAAAPGSVLGDAREADPREVARVAVLGQWAYRAGQVESGWCGVGVALGDQTVRTGERTSARVLARKIASQFRGSASLVTDAREVEPAALPPGTVAYIDPPYAGTTGYDHDLTRDEVAGLAMRWADAGARVVVSEAEPLDLPGWHAVEITNDRRGQKRTFSRQQREWLTCSHPPARRQPMLFDLGAA